MQGFITDLTPVFGIFFMSSGDFYPKKVVVCCTIWYHLYNLKNVKNTHGGVLILDKPATLLKLTLLDGCSSRFLNCTNSTKSRNASQLRRGQRCIEGPVKMMLMLKLISNTLLIFSIKVRLSPPQKFVFLYFNKSPLKIMKNAFYFMLKALFVLEIFSFLSWLFGYVKERFDKKTVVNFKIYDVTDWTTDNCNTYVTLYLKK